jgi:hypothetical protein
MLSKYADNANFIQPTGLRPRLSDDASGPGNVFLVPGSEGCDGPIFIFTQSILPSAPLELEYPPGIGTPHANSVPLFLMIWESSQRHSVQFGNPHPVFDRVVIQKMHSGTDPHSTTKYHSQTLTVNELKSAVGDPVRILFKHFKI